MLSPETQKEALVVLTWKQKVLYFLILSKKDFLCIARIYCIIRHVSRIFLPVETDGEGFSENWGDLDARVFWDGYGST